MWGGGYLPGGAGPHKEDGIVFAHRTPRDMTSRGRRGGGLGPMSHDTRDPLKRQFQFETLKLYYIIE